jgi:hypothetical protein
MVAIVTDRMKKLILDQLIDDLQSVDSASSTYYIGLGKSDQWNDTETVPSPTNVLKEEREARNNLQAIKKVTDISLVTNRYGWSNGVVYNAYNPNVSHTTNGRYYVLSEQRRVYICLQSPKTSSGTNIASVVDPDTIGTAVEAKKLADNYVWKYLYTLSAVQANKFLTANFIPVANLDSAGVAVTAIETAQANVQTAAVSGEIIGYEIAQGGVGYSSVPTLEVIGDGTGAAPTAVLNAAGAIIDVRHKDSTDGNPVFGSGYTGATITISGGSPSTAAVIKPIISLEGIGKDAREDIRATSVMFNAKPSGTDSDFLIGQDFRQITLITDPKKHNDSDFNDLTGRALRKLTVSSVTGTISNDKIMRDSAAGPTAFIDLVDGTEIYYHRNDEFNFLPWNIGSQITDSTGTFTATIESDSQGEVNPFSGDILYIENRAPVTRSSEQIEDIKLILQL